jgi:NAD(P)-dependent dehydrogenase (short-subunit alcohol dehydrogenase family)
MKKDGFQDQVAIVTGASSGIGRALALQLAGQGARVVLAARRAGLLEEIAGACRDAGGEALAVPTDVADEAQCKALIDKCIAEFGRLDMLVNNAGLTVIARLEDYPDLRLFRHVMDVNYRGAVYCTYYALAHLIRSHGRIVAVSSLGGKAPLPYNSPYIASKFAMHGFFDSVRMEVKQYGVSVTIACPYWVVTGFHEAQMDKDGRPRGSAGRAIYSRNMMTAERCAELILRAAYRRKREVLMGPGRAIAWLKLLAPGLLDRMLIRFLKATVRREQRNALPQ